MPVSFCIRLLLGQVVKGRDRLQNFHETAPFWNSVCQVLANDPGAVRLDSCLTRVTERFFDTKVTLHWT